jgi:hypothetical protein
MRSLVAVALLASLTAVNAGYDPQLGLHYAYVAGSAYCSQSQLETWSWAASGNVTDVSFVSYAYDETNNLAAWVGRTSDGSGLVSFRGTIPSSLKNWITDLEAGKQVPYDGCDGCKVHDGFYDGWKALSGQILQALQSIGGTGLPRVDVTGHSLGAAMAAIASYELGNRGYTVGDVYTYGQPRVGNPSFADALMARLPQNIRVTHWDDIVVHLPYQWMGYHHPALEIFYNEANTAYTVCNGSGEDDNCADQFDGASISDHLHYVGIPISELC